MIEKELPISLVFADCECEALALPREKGIPVEVIPRRGKRGDDMRRQYTLEVAEMVRRYEIGLIAMAGFMTILDKVFFAVYGERVLNIHPSLLPAFKGDSAPADALEFGVKIAGTTIHWATENLDDGKIVAQEAVRVFEDDTVESLHERIKTVERELYPKVVLELLKKLPD
jgi:phosphoribosylglycinamide formyltransferase-1